LGRVFTVEDLFGGCIYLGKKLSNSKKSQIEFWERFKDLKEKKETST